VDYSVNKLKTLRPRKIYWTNLQSLVTLQWLKGSFQRIRRTMKGKSTKYGKLIIRSKIYRSTPAMKLPAKQRRLERWWWKQRQNEVDNTNSSVWGVNVSMILLAFKLLKKWCDMAIWQSSYRFNGSQIQKDTLPFPNGG